jgi:predicted RNA-binding protein YlxR (DUF448 family)
LRKTATPEDDEIEEKETGPLRRCLVKRESFARETMLRFVVAPDQTLVFDVTATLPGRGLWLSASADVIHSAIKSGILSRAAKQRVTIPPEFLLLVTTALERRLIELLGLARRGGNAICGFEKAREWLQEQKAGLVVQAADGSADERARFCSGSAVKQVVLLDAARLGKIFGREQAVHVVIGAGRLAKMIENEADRLAAVAGRGRSGQ